MKKKSKIEKYTDQEALDDHNSGKSGKIEILSSKPMTSKRDLALAYSPGVAAPVKEIAKDPNAAYDYTTKGNLVAVISNGSAILGLGNLGALASKPVMEGKAILFKRFADIDSIDLELDSSNACTPNSPYCWKKNQEYKIGSELWTYCSNRAFLTIYSEEEFKQILESSQDAALDEIFSKLIVTEHYFKDDMTDAELEAKMAQVFSTLTNQEVLKKCEKNGITIFYIDF